MGHEKLVSIPSMHHSFVGANNTVKALSQLVRLYFVILPWIDPSKAQRHLILEWLERLSHDLLDKLARRRQYHGPRSVGDGQLRIRLDLSLLETMDQGDGVGERLASSRLGCQESALTLQEVRYCQLLYGSRRSNQHLRA